MSGLIADAKTLIDKARVEAQVSLFFIDSFKLCEINIQIF